MAQVAGEGLDGRLEPFLEAVGPQRAASGGARSLRLVGLGERKSI